MYVRSSNLTAKLQTLGLTHDEAEAYLAVVKLGLCKVNEISREASLHRVQVYHMMPRLVSIGLVQETLDRPKRFRPTSIENAIKTLKEEALSRYSDLANRTDDLITSLQKLEAKVEGDGEQQVRVITGVHNQQRDLEQKIASAKDEILIMMRPHHSIHWRSYVRRNLRAVASRHLKARAILEVNNENASFAKWLSSVFEVRHYEPLPVHLHIVDDRAVTVGLDATTHRDPERVSELSTSYPGYAKMIHEFFDVTWKQAVPLDVRLEMLRGHAHPTLAQTRIIWGREAILKEQVGLRLRAKKRVTEIASRMGPVRLVRFTEGLLDGTGREVDWRVICNLCPENLDAVKKLSTIANVRHSEREFALGISVFDDSEAIIRLMDPDSPDVMNRPGDIAIYTSNQSIAIHLSRMLDWLWKRSEPIERILRRMAPKRIR